MADEPSNGATTKVIATITLELRADLTLNITGAIPHFDCAINMLQQATRVYEDQRRMTVLQSIKQRVADEQLVRKLKLD